jgi:dTMP kinase
LSSIEPIGSGAFIVVEGIDGSGTTTQSRRLAEALRAAGNEVRLTCEPTDGAIGVLIRQLLEQAPPLQEARRRAFRWSTMALLFAADRLEHLETVVLPALRAGAVVVSDRYYLSSLAYQSVTAPDGSDVVPWLRELNRHATKPDLTIVIDVSPELAAARRGQRGDAPQLFESDDVQRRLAVVYANAERLVPEDRVVHISGDAPHDIVTARIVESIKRAGLRVQGI